MKAVLLFALAATLGCIPAVVARAGEIVEGLSPVDLFNAASRAVSEGRSEDALAFYRALATNPDLEIRTEARFRMGMLLSSLGRGREAAESFRVILDEKPDAARVRLELARVLVGLGDTGAARRELRQASAGPLPPQVAEVVNRFAAALRSTKRLGASLELGVAPDSNINRATDARTLDTVIAPLTLDKAARAQSGIGLDASGQAYLRQPLSAALSLVPRITGQGSFYKDHQFDDVSASALIGFEWQLGRDRITPSAGRTWRWYGKPLYATTDTLAVTYLHPVGRRAQLVVNASAAHARYKLNRLQSGGLFDVSAGGELALSPRAGIGGSIGLTRQDARDPGYATTSGQLSLYGWREFGRTTLFASASLRRTEGDARLFLFKDRRKEWHYRLSAGAAFRSLSIAGLAPLMRIGFERNSSTVGIYDYRRVNAELGVTRAF